MMEELRSLLYPLGFLSSLLFGWRFLQQWITSELYQKSIVPRSFWQISFAGNLLLMIHAFFQLQFHVCIIQACNAIISWRNLDLMKPKEEQESFRFVIGLMVSSVLGITLGLLLQAYFLEDGYLDLFRTPTWWSISQVSLVWHLLGFLGLILFSSRFWLQWWDAEKTQTSNIRLSFWWLSLSGGLLSLFYFYKIGDPVNILGPAFGLIPYVRNLMLIYQEREKTVIS